MLSLHVLLLVLMIEDRVYKDNMYEQGGEDDHVGGLLIEIESASGTRLSNQNGPM